ncbi:MAG: hypothetical protein LIP23_02660 [Planctomycetes bacterium]|nr:hypothetical protein [Planctomycetota bacterium]
MSVDNRFSVRNTNELHPRTCQKSGVAKHILDADAFYEQGSFTLFSLPCKLPTLFTVRFTAPADYQQGDKFKLKEQEFVVKTRNMTDPYNLAFSAGAVVQCDVDMERNLVFIASDKVEIEIPEPEPEHPCYLNRVEAYVEQTGSDEEGDGSQALPFRTIAGMFSFLEREYSGKVFNLVVRLGRGHFEARREWTYLGQPFWIPRLEIIGKNSEDQSLTSTTIGDNGMAFYDLVHTVRLNSVSIRNNGESSIIHMSAMNCLVTIYGWCHFINNGTSTIDAITMTGRAFLHLGDNPENDKINFTGTFNRVVYATSHSVINMPVAPTFEGTSQYVILVNGGSTLYLYSPSIPTFVGSFRGDMRARNGSTIAISGANPANWLPSGSQWVKDDTSRITGQ